MIIKHRTPSRSGLFVHASPASGFFSRGTMNTKTCKKCEKEKPATAEFWHKQREGKYDLKAVCKTCINKKSTLPAASSGMKICRRCGKEHPATTDFFHKSKHRKCGLVSRCKACVSVYRAKPENKQQRNKRLKERRKTDINYQIKSNLRTRLSLAVQGKNKSAATLELLGCTIDRLKNHLEYHFTDGMNWGNYGKWHVDHIIPCASFDLSDPEEQKKCFHYTNLQPLWGIDNIRKGGKS